MTEMIQDKNLCGIDATTVMKLANTMNGIHIGGKFVNPGLLPRELFLLSEL